MRWIKKIIRVILCLFPAFSLFFVSIDVSATAHKYLGIPYGAIEIGCGAYPSGSNGCITATGTGFGIDFKGDAWDSSYSDLKVNFSQSRIRPMPSLERDDCYYYGDINPIFGFSSDLKEIRTSLGGPVSPYYMPEDWRHDWDSKCNRLNRKYGEMPPLAFRLDSLPGGLLQCNRSNGASCGGLWKVSEYVQSQILPYSYSSSGFFIHSKAVDANGIHYNNTFSFSDMFNSYIPTFSYLQIPLHDLNSDYFFNQNNLYSGRQFEWRAAFEFDGSFDWHENINNNGSFFRVHINGDAIDSSSVTGWTNVDEYYDCTTNLISLPGTLTRLEFSCPVSLQHSFYNMSPRFEISGNDNYVWRTDNKWYFAYSLLISDNDETPGSSFNSEISGGGTKIGDAQNIIDAINNNNNSIMIGADYDASLINLFGFTLLNPFAPLLLLFTSQEQCANIPTIASMLHSESSQVCPFFPASVRNIVTPVLGISAVMLLFGFVVRWLGARSGNFFEDSGSIESPGTGREGDNLVFHGWRIKK